MTLEIEEIITQIEKNNEQIAELVQANVELNRELQTRPESEWDWVSVQSASQKLDVSPAMLYQRIQRGKLTTKRINSKILVSMKELNAINDRENA